MYFEAICKTKIIQINGFSIHSLIAAALKIFYFIFRFIIISFSMQKIENIP